MSELDLLSFEEFIDRKGSHIPTYNNLNLNIVWGTQEPLISRNSDLCEPYLRFKKEHLKLFESIREKLRNLKRGNSLADVLKPVESNLYKAYKILRTYGVSDETLFA